MGKTELRHRGPKLRGGLMQEDAANDDKQPGGIDKSSKITGAVIVIVISVLISYYRYQQYLKDIVRTPLDSPRIISENSSLASVNPDRFWGTYRLSFSLRFDIKSINENIDHHVSLLVKKSVCLCVCSHFPRSPKGTAP